MGSPKLPPIEVCVICRKPIRIPYEECIAVQYKLDYPLPVNPRLPAHLRYLAHPECYDGSDADIARVGRS